MSPPLHELEPRALWTCFDGIRRVPRPSKQEQKISAHVADWAAGEGFELRRDAAGNMVIEVPATPGCEGAPRVVLQAHLDMVCEKNAEIDHDFATDPIRAVVEGDWVRADGTTLGADNGVGVAAAMAAAVDPDIAHGPLELLFTLDEETGLNGAAALEPELVRGRLLINLDSEEEAIFIGCAGAGSLSAELPLERQPALEGVRRPAVELRLRGLRGGHSGIDIGRGLGNAVKLLAATLLAARADGIDFELVAFSGGDKGNVIPREAAARLFLASPEGLSALEAWTVERQGHLRSQYRLDPSLTLELAELASLEAPLVSASLDRFLGLIDAVPHGVRGLSPDMPELVETSCNLARVELGSRSASMLCACRSSVDAALTEVLSSLGSVCRLAGATYETRSGYPGWRPDPDSTLVRQAAETYARLFSRRPRLMAVHAGLECGLLARKLPGLEAVSIGPVIEGAHSPEERVQVSSVKRFYRHLATLLCDLAAPPAGA